MSGCKASTPYLPSWETDPSKFITLYCDRGDQHWLPRKVVWIGAISRERKERLEPGRPHRAERHEGAFTWE